MVLKNYWKLLENYQKNSVWGSSAINVDIGLKGLNGSAVNILQSTTDWGYMPYLAQNLRMDYNLSLRAGSGSSPATASDYALANDVTNNLSNVKTTYLSSADDAGIIRKMSISGSNFTNNAITIRKIGVVKGIWSVPSGFEKADVLLAVIELENPVVVNKGENFNIVIEWNELN